MLRYLLELDEVLYNKGIDYGFIIKELKVSKAVIDGLIKKGIIGIESAKKYRNPFIKEAFTENKHTLNERQQYIKDSILSDFNTGIRKTYLIHGVTGSGKTEVYMSVIDEVVAQKTGNCAYTRNSSYVSNCKQVLQPFWYKSFSYTFKAFGW